MKKLENILIFLYGKNKRTRFIRIMITLVVVALVVMMLLGVSIDLGPIQIKPVADININK